jgi:hypothetical protein
LLDDGSVLMSTFFGFVSRLVIATSNQKVVQLSTISVATTRRKNVEIKACIYVRV